MFRKGIESPSLYERTAGGHITYLCCNLCKDPQFYFLHLTYCNQHIASAMSLSRATDYLGSRCAEIEVGIGRVITKDNRRCHDLRMKPRRLRCDLYLRHRKDTARGSRFKALRLSCFSKTRSRILAGVAIRL